MRLQGKIVVWDTVVNADAVDELIP